MGAFNTDRQFVGRLASKNLAPPQAGKTMFPCRLFASRITQNVVGKFSINLGNKKVDYVHLGPYSAVRPMDIVSMVGPHDISKE